MNGEEGKAPPATSSKHLLIGGKMPTTFTRTFRVRWAEINAVGQLGLTEYFRYVIETAWDWGPQLGWASLRTTSSGWGG